MSTHASCLLTQKRIRLIQISANRGGIFPETRGRWCPLAERGSARSKPKNGTDRGSAPIQLEGMFQMALNTFVGDMVPGKQGLVSKHRRTL